MKRLATFFRWYYDIVMFVFLCVLMWATMLTITSKGDFVLIIEHEQSQAFE